MANEELLENVKAWLNLDNEIKSLQKEIKSRRNQKKELTENLMSVMKVNDIEQIDLSDGQLIYTKKKTRAPLSKKHLLESLSKFFQNDARTVTELSKYIMDSRAEKEKENIKRKVKK